MTMSFAFSFDNPLFYFSSLLLRGLLCLVTLLVTAWYSWALRAAHKRPLPEQQWVRVALVLLLCQDAVLFLPFAGSRGWRHVDNQGG